MTFNIEKLIRARQLKRWSRAEIAARTGYSEQMVYLVETGRRKPSESLILAWSAVLDVPMEKILPPLAPTRRKRA